jgi:hypothetical protein
MSFLLPSMVFLLFSPGISFETIYSLQFITTSEQSFLAFLTREQNYFSPPLYLVHGLSIMGTVCCFHVFFSTGVLFLEARDGAVFLASRVHPQYLYSL